MAILEECPGLKVEVLVEDSPLQEHVDEDEPEAAKIVTRYVEAQTGENFVIKCFFLGHSPLVKASPQKSFWAGSLRVSAAHPRIGTKTFAQEFDFTTLDITEERSPVSKEFLKKVSKIGTITVTFHFFRIDDPGFVSEKAMKSDEKSHRASLAAAEQISNVKYYLVDLVEATLQALRIAPLPEEPTPDDDHEKRGVKQEDEEEQTVVKREVKEEETVIKRDITDDEPSFADSASEDGEHDVKQEAIQEYPDTDFEDNDGTPAIIDRELPADLRPGASKCRRDKNGRFTKTD